jgi:Na+/melibiose symporter-like transporter
VADPLTSRLSWPTRIAYGAGIAPETWKSSGWDLFVLFYYTQVLGLPGTLTGAAIAAALAVDAVTDPLVGMWSDNLRRAPLGRRHTLMAASILPFAGAFAALFMPPAGLGGFQLFLWLLCFAVITRIGITLWTIPFYAVGVELSREPEERSRLIAIRTIGSNAARFSLTWAAFTFFFVASPQYPRGQLNPAAYPGFGLAIALAATLVMVVTIAATRRPLQRIHDAESPAAYPRLPLGTVFRQFLPTIRLTPNIYIVIAVTLAVFAVLSTSNVLTLHLSTYYWQLEGPQIRDVQLAQVPGTIIAALLATRVIRRLDKKRTMIAGVAGFCACVLLPVLLPMLGALPPPGTPELARALMAFQFLEGLTYGSFLVATGATAADIADEHEANTGRPQQGALPGITFFCTKASSAAINLAVGVLLDLVRFPVGAKVADVPQDKVAQLAVFTVVVVSSAALLLVWVISRYDISADKQARINERLRALRAGVGPGAPAAAGAATLPAATAPATAPGGSPAA